MRGEWTSGGALGQSWDGSSSPGSAGCSFATVPTSNLFRECLPSTAPHQGSTPAANGPTHALAAAACTPRRCCSHLRSRSAGSSMFAWILSRMNCTDATGEAGGLWDCKRHH